MTTPNEGTPNPAAPAEGTGAPAAPGTPAVPIDTPIEYAFKAPEGVTYDTSMVEQVTAFAKELKMPLEAAQKLIDSQHALVNGARTAVTEAQAKALADTTAAWKKALQDDPEFGGDKLPEHRAIVNKAVSLGDAELVNVLESSGMINHPVVFKFLHSIGQKLSEDRFVKPGAQPGATRNVAKVLYPNNA